jgi:hypothetical protein
MGLILSLIAALAGSVAGSGVRAGIRMAEQQLNKTGAAGEPVMVNGSLVGGVAAGVVADAIGGPTLAFWLGAVLGAAGADRLDFWILRRVGVNPDELMAKARDAAMEAQEKAKEMAASRRAPSPETEPLETT